MRGFLIILFGVPIFCFLTDSFWFAVVFCIFIALTWNLMAPKKDRRA